MEPRRGLFDRNVGGEVTSETAAPEVTRQAGMEEDNEAKDPRRVLFNSNVSGKIPSETAAMEDIDGKITIKDEDEEKNVEDEKTSRKNEDEKVTMEDLGEDLEEEYKTNIKLNYRSGCELEREMAKKRSEGASSKPVELRQAK